MRRFFSAVLLVLAISPISATFASDFASEQGIANLLPTPSTLQYPTLGGFCSAYTTDGHWAFYYGYMSPAQACQNVQANLSQFTFAPLARWNSGYYNMNGWNIVDSQCWNYRNRFQGNSGFPLQQAYNNAVYGRASACLFGVYY